MMKSNRSLIACLLVCLVMTIGSSADWAGVFYRVDGVLQTTDGITTLLTDAGRIFQLEIDKAAAKTNEGAFVRIEGYAPEGNQVEKLSVKTVRVLTPDEMKAVPPEHHIRQKQPVLIDQHNGLFTVDSVRWGFKVNDHKVITEYFWKRAKIDPTLVDQVYFIKKPFAPEWIAAHSCLLFTFKPGGLVNAEGKQAKGLLLSVEAHLTKTQKYDLKEGLKRKFGAIWLLITWEDYAAEACDAQARGAGKMFLYPSKLTAAQKQEMLREAIRQATIDRSGEFYHTTRNNCTNTLVMLFNHVIEKKIPLWTIPGLIYNLKATMPVWVPDTLRKRGLVGDPLPEINNSNYFVEIEKIAAGSGKAASGR